MMLDPLTSDSPVIVYLDFKSPYAYLAVEPTRALEKTLDVQFDWRPFVLDIPSYLGSARLDSSGNVVEQRRSEGQWAAVKYAYYDCRRYAILYNLKIRSTEKIWDTNLAATALLWAKQFGRETEQHLIDQIYPPFWRRELDIEDISTLEDVLDKAGASPAGFRAWAAEEGAAANAQLQRDAFAAGIYGVPTYVAGNELYFGREHLPYLQWQLTKQHGTAPDIANPIPSKLPPEASLPNRVTIGVDDSADSLLALPQLVTLLTDFAGEIHWVCIEKTPLLDSRTSDSGSRSSQHQQWRDAEQQRNRQRYESRATSRDGAVDAFLGQQQIELQSAGPDLVRRPALPGIVVLLDNEIFIGRQHLPLIAARLQRNR